MKRFIVVPLILGALAVPATASAAYSNAATGKISSATAKLASGKGTQFSIRFTEYRFNGKPKFVDNFRVKNLPATCDQGAALLNYTLVAGTPNDNIAFKVNSRRKFNAKGSDGAASSQVTGKFKDNGKVRGRAKASGDWPADGGGTLTNCTASQPYVTN